MKLSNQQRPFDLLAQISNWIDENIPITNDAQKETNRKYQKVLDTIANLRNMSVPIPNELTSRAQELEDQLNTPDEHRDVMLELANGLSALAKTIRSQYNRTGRSTKGPRKRLRVKLPDGTTLCEPTAVETFIRTLQWLSLQRCSEVQKVFQFGHPVVSKEPNQRGIAQKEIDGYFIETNSNTPLKASILTEYARELDIRIEVRIDD